MINTSIQAYKQILPELGSRQLSVYQTIKKLEYCTNAMISKELNLPVNQITPRTFELRKLKIDEKYLVVRSHISRCPITKHSAQYWKIKLNDGEDNGRIQI